MEKDEGGKKVIARKLPAQRAGGSLVENAIAQLEANDKISRIPDRDRYGTTREEITFAVALELVITWLNRILFLKLLDGQIRAWRKDAKPFLSIDVIKDYSALNALFFKVLALPAASRPAELRARFAHVPYLNSSLFEQTEIEYDGVFINTLSNEETIPIYADTILRDSRDKKRTEAPSSLAYLFAFLDAYDFGAEPGDETKESRKSLINAAVLGLIFEKINGYRDGSFYTPGYITMYICRETIRRAVIRKFNKAKNWNCKTLDEIYNEITDPAEANAIINSIRICDPAVGSGHFLVSALNELIAIKHRLRILRDRDGKRLRDYNIEVAHDELYIGDPDGDPFEYRPALHESLRVQRTIFHEKQTLIENCLFGVDINPNSVKICRLRLWIELLKNAYYRQDTGELETLPNIDINIKQGNSLIGRFPLDMPIKVALENAGVTQADYLSDIGIYHRAPNKATKQEVEKRITGLTKNIAVELSEQDPLKKALRKIDRELYSKKEHPELAIEHIPQEQAALGKKLKELTESRAAIDAKIGEKTKRYHSLNAFEWRYEFPQVLDDNGQFVGFDVIVGNPPYIQLQNNGGELGNKYKDAGFATFARTGDTYALFYERAYELLSEDGLLCFITSNKWMRAGYGASLREFLAKKTQPFVFVDFAGQKVFDSATVDTNILLYEKGAKPDSETLSAIATAGCRENLSRFVQQNAVPCAFNTSESWVILTPIEQSIKAKVEKIGKPLKDWDVSISFGIKTGYDEAFVIDEAKRCEILANCTSDDERQLTAALIRPILRGRDIKRYSHEWKGHYLIAMHNGIPEKGIPRIDEKKCKAIVQHLNSYWEKIEARSDQGDTPYHLRSCAYMDDFSKPKIIYPNMTKFLPFLFDNKGFAANAKCFIIVGESIAFLTAFLNSSLFKYCFRNNFPELQGGTRELRKMFFDTIPVLSIDNETDKKFETKIIEIQKLKSENVDTKSIEVDIDNMIFDLYNLTDEERKVIGFVEIQ